MAAAVAAGDPEAHHCLLVEAGNGPAGVIRTPGMCGKATAAAAGVAAAAAIKCLPHLLP